MIEEAFDDKTGGCRAGNYSLSREVSVNRRRSNGDKRGNVFRRDR